MESYINQSLFFKLRKGSRYVTLYGPARTLAKVKGQYHLQSAEEFEGAVWTNPGCRSPDHPDRFVGLIGCGSFPFSTIAHDLRKSHPNFLRSTYDLSRARARSLCKEYGGAYAAGAAEDMLADDKVKLIYIASNHASHAEYAIQGLDAGKHVHIEKPHVVTEDQLTRLNDAQKRNPDSMVFLGFNRPRSDLFQKAMRSLSGQSGPLMVNWFIAGHKIVDDHWYFSEAEGGRILGNLCHWTDLTLQMVGLEAAFPCRISAVCAREAKSDFAISIVFADDSVAAITFSAKGHTFEGVREILNAHRGDVLLSLNDFHGLRIDQGANRQKHRKLFRDHGHNANIQNSFDAVQAGDRTKAVSAAYANATARLFLAVKHSVDQRIPVELDLAGPIGQGASHAA